MLEGKKKEGGKGREEGRERQKEMGSWEEGEQDRGHRGHGSWQETRPRL